MNGIKNLIKIAKKSHDTTIIRREVRHYKTNSTTKVEKGHFVVYTVDGHRFVFPLGHLKSYIFRELLTMSEEEFGLPSSGPITFPCDASFMKAAADLVHQHVVLAKERSLLQNLVTKSCNPSFYVGLEKPGNN